MFKMAGMDYLFSPFERDGIFVTELSESVYGSAYIPDGVGTQSTKSLPPENTEPALDLVEPGGVCRNVVEMDIRVTGQPTIVFGLMDIQVVENDMQLLVGILCYDAIHEVKELPPPSSAIVTDLHQSRRHLQGGKQGGSAMAFVLMAESSQGVSVRQTQPALSSLQSLNGRLLVYTENESILWWMQIKSDNIRGLPGKLRVSAHTPTAAPLQVYAMLPEYPPDLVTRYLSQCLGDQLAGPTVMSCRRSRLQLSQNAFFRVLVIPWLPSRAGRILQSLKAMLSETLAPLYHHSSRQPNLLGYRLISHPFGRQQDKTCSLHCTVCCGSSTSSFFKLLSFFCCQHDCCTWFAHTL